jgi:hypothetical protein
MLALSMRPRSAFAQYSPCVLSGLKAREIDADIQEVMRISMKEADR